MLHGYRYWRRLASKGRDIFMIMLGLMRHIWTNISWRSFHLSMAIIEKHRLMDFVFESPEVEFIAEYTSISLFYGRIKIS
jgi:hypothetical protein